MAEPQTRNPIVAALLRERDGYLRTGRPERAAQVTEYLARFGYTDPADEESGPALDGDPAAEPPRKRQVPTKRTA